MIESTEVGGAKTDTFHGSFDVVGLSEVALPDALIGDDHDGAK
jgi:hypothetical protein